MNLTTFRKILIVLFMLASSVIIFRQLARKNSDFLSLTSFYGNELISNQELQNYLKQLNLDHKSILEINSQTLSQYLIKHPLIEDAKIKTLLVPQKSYRIYIREAKPWAIYRGQIWDTVPKVLVKSTAESRLYSSTAIRKLYMDFANNNSTLVSIQSAVDLNSKQIQIIKTVYDLLSSDLQAIDKKEIIYLITIDKEVNLNFFSRNFELRTGVLDEKLIKRSARFKALVPKIIELGGFKKISYVNLSLTTSEAILGKHEHETLN